MTFELGWNAAIEKAAKWHEAEAERIRLLALDPHCDNIRKMHVAQDDHINFAATIRSLTLPSDLVAVPREPTQTMKVNGGLAFEDSAFGRGKLVFEAAGDAYRAMLAAHKED